MLRLLVLFALSKMNKERSSSAPYYILQGKQSIQTIQDANLFQLNHLFGIYKNLSKEKYSDVIQNLMKENDVIELKDNRCKVTPKGENWLNNHSDFLKRFYFNGQKYKQIDDVFYLRLLLTIQVWTNKYKNNATYIPIVEHKEVERWVKQYYKRTKQTIAHSLQQLHDELIDLLGNIHPTYAEIFVSQLTGYKKIGMTSEQLAHQFQMEKEDVHLITVHVIHYILCKLENEEAKYPVLSELNEGLYFTKKLTNSAKITLKMLQQGLSISQIAMKRQLKENTINDHLVEIAMYDEQFPFHVYVNVEEEQQIRQAVYSLKSYTLKEIKKEVSEEITYFQIRLILAKLNKRGEKTEQTI